MKKLRKTFRAHWRRNIFLLFVALSSIGLLLPQLASLAPRFSPAEQQTLAASDSLHAIMAHPLYLPFKLLQWTCQLLPSHTIAAGRLASVLVGLLSLLLFVYILRRWYGPRTTFFGFVIFLTSAWFLHVSRFAGTDIVYLGAMLALLAAHVSLYHSSRPLTFYTWIIVQIGLLFIPGMVWFVLLNLLWQRSEILEGWRECSGVYKRSGWVILLLAGVSAIATMLVRSPDLLRPWLGVPAQFAPVHELARSFADTLLFIGFRGPHDPAQWLGRLPLLDAFLSIMFIAGVIFYGRHWRAARTRLLTSYFLVGVSLVSLAGPVKLSVFVPIIYLVVTAGIAYVLHEWLSVFPRNPLARGVGIGIVLVTVALSCTYNIRQYVIAWPHNTETRAIYRN